MYSNYKRIHTIYCPFNSSFTYLLQNDLAKNSKVAFYEFVLVIYRVSKFFNVSYFYISTYTYALQFVLCLPPCIFIFVPILKGTEVYGFSHSNPSPMDSRLVFFLKKIYTKIIYRHCITVRHRSNSV